MASMSFVLAFIACDTCHANEIEKKFIEAGLVDIHTIDESIKVDLVNSDPDKNYFRENFYDGLNRAYLRREHIGRETVTLVSCDRIRVKIREGRQCDADCIIWEANARC